MENQSDTTEVTNWLKENHSKDKNYQKLKPMKLTSNPIILFYDLETGGFRKTADIIQIAITKGNGNHSQGMNVFVMPKKKLDGRSVKVHGYTVSYKTGKKTLMNRENEEMPAVSPLEAAKAVTEYLIDVCRSSESPVLLIAHNGHSFDQPRLLTFLREQGQMAKLAPFMGKIYFSDSKSTFKETFSLEKNSLNSVYAHVFGEANYAAHDAYGDVQALSDIFIASKFSKILEEKVILYSRELESIEKKEEISMQMEDERCNLYKIIKSDSVAMRLSRRGISVRVLREMWDKFGEHQCVSFFCTCDVRAKLPRVSKNVKVLQMIVRALKC